MRVKKDIKEIRGRTLTAATGSFKIKR